MKKSNVTKMRKINKFTPLPNFNGSNYNRNCTTWKDFHKLYKNIYEDSRWQILIDEQKQQCGYTELYIDNLEDSHIDHYKKRSLFPSLTFDWDNFIVATKDNNFGANYKDNNYSIQANEYVDIYNPVHDGVEDYFTYTEWGEIEEIPGKVKKTVDVFNLNDDYLQKRREKIIKLIDGYKRGGLPLVDIKLTLQEYGFKSIVEQYCV